MKKIGTYTIDETPVGSGGASNVFKGRDADGKPVAIKVYRLWEGDDEVRTKRLKRAIDVQKSGSPNVVKIRTVFEEGGYQYVVMDLVEGNNLREQIAAYGAMPEDGAAGYMSSILKALKPLHDKGIVHHDLMPEHVMISPLGDVTLLRFDTNESSSPAVGYRSPEQAEGMTTDHRTDLYSLGCLLYFMMTGREPFTSSGNSKTQLLPDMGNLSPLAQEILLRATDKNMKKRYQTCSEFIDALEPLVNPIAIDSLPPLEENEPVIAAPPKKKMSSWSIIAIVAAITAVLCVAGWLAYEYHFKQAWAADEPVPAVSDSVIIDTADTADGDSIVASPQGSDIKHRHKGQKKNGGAKNTFEQPQAVKDAVQKRKEADSNEKGIKGVNNPDRNRNINKTQGDDL